MQPLSIQQQQLNVVMDRLQIDMGFNARFNTFNATPQMNIMHPHPNAQQPQMHQNLARIPPNAHMPMNNFIVSINLVRMLLSSILFIIIGCNLFVLFALFFVLGLLLFFGAFWVFHLTDCNCR